MYKNKMDFQNRTKKRKNTKNFSSDVAPNVIVNPIGNQDLLDGPQRKKRKRFSFEEKKNILEAMNQHPPDVICKKYELRDRTLSKWKSEKEEIFQEANKTNSKKFKKKFNAEKMDHAVFQWLVETQDKGIPISGPMIRQQALIVKENHPKKNQFKASDGWLSKFQKRQRIRSLKITGEKLSADDATAKLYQENLKKMVATKNLQEKQIFNMDESGIYIKQVPSRTLAPKTKTSISGTKKQLERVTVAACTNVDGSLKLPLVFIGKYLNPRCFKYLNKDDLPVKYYNQKNAWMDKTVFEDWFRNHFVPKVKNFLMSNNLPQKAVLIVDNCRAHKYPKVDDIEVDFFPPNVTSLIQPLDQGIFQTLKLNYQKLLVDSILQSQNKAVQLLDFLKSIKIKEAIFWCAEAWNKVFSATIVSSWKQLWSIKKRDVGIQTDEDFSLSLLGSESSVGTESVPSLSYYDDLTQLLQSVHNIQGYETVDKETFVEWLENKERVSEGRWTNEEIIAQVNESAESSNHPEKPFAQPNPTNSELTIDFSFISSTFSVLNEDNVIQEP